MKAFEELKAYIQTPFLIQPVPDKNLFLQLIVTYEDTSSILILEDVGIQRHIYYTSRILKDMEKNHS